MFPSDFDLPLRKKLSPQKHSYASKIKKKDLRLFLTMVKVVHSIPSVTHIADKFLITEKKLYFLLPFDFP